MSEQIPSLVSITLNYMGGDRPGGVVDKLALKLLLGSLRAGIGLNGYCQNLLVGPLQIADGVGVWIARLNSSAELHIDRRRKQRLRTKANRPKGSPTKGNSNVHSS